MVVGRRVIWYWVLRYVLTSGARIEMVSSARMVNLRGVDGDWERSGIERGC